jgi:hypothetical protein
LELTGLTLSKVYELCVKGGARRKPNQLTGGRVFDNGHIPFLVHNDTNEGALVG